MSRTRRSAFLALFGYVAVVAAGCRRDPALSNRPSAPAQSSPATATATEIVPDTPDDVGQIQRLLAFVAAQKNIGERKRLIWEQYLYCADIVSQGAGHVSALANELSAPAWFFWWD